MIPLIYLHNCSSDRGRKRLYIGVLLEPISLTRGPVHHKAALKDKSPFTRPHRPMGSFQTASYACILDAGRKRETHADIRRGHPNSTQKRQPTPRFKPTTFLLAGNAFVTLDLRGRRGVRQRCPGTSPTEVNLTL